MMLRDRLLARLVPGQAPDYQEMAREVLGVRGASPGLARTLVEQALVFEDRYEHWRRVGERARREAPAAPGVYVFRDWAGTALYVGKAANLRRRLTAHFSYRRWLVLPPPLAGVETIEWQQAGSEIEALLREALLIRDLQPVVNIQTAAPTLGTRAIPPSLLQDVVLLVPSIDPEAAELVAAREDGATMLLRTRRNGRGLARHSRILWTFFTQRSATAVNGAAPLVFSWLARRGQRTTRLNPDDHASARELRIHLARLLADQGLFSERLVTIQSGGGTCFAPSLQEVGMADIKPSSDRRGASEEVPVYGKDSIQGTRNDDVDREHAMGNGRGSSVVDEEPGPDDADGLPENARRRVPS